MGKRYKIKEEMVTNAGGVGEYSTPKAFKKYRIKEIKVNPPSRKARITSGDENEIIVYKDKVKYQDNPQEIERALQQQGVRDIFDDDLNNTYWTLIRFIGDEGEVLPEEYWWDQNEINYNINELNENHLPEPKDFPIKISSYEQAQLVGQWLQKHSYNLNIDQPPFNTKPLLNPFYVKADGKNIHFDLLNEIKVNKPGELPLDKHDVEFEKIFFQIEKKYPNEHPQVQWIITNKLFKKKFGVGVGEKQLNESKYSQFKQSTSKPNPKQILHKAIKEIQLKLDEVNKLIDFTSRIKGELTEGDQEIEYLKRTKDNINKIQNRLKEVFNKLCELDEIKVNKPTKIIDFLNTPYSTWKDIKVGDKIKLPNGDIEEIEKLYLPKARTKSGEYNLVRLYNQNHAKTLSEIKVNKPKRIWDFTKYIPNFNPKNIKIGDKIKTKRYVLVIDDIQDEGGNLQFYSPQGMDDEETLNQINNKNHTKTLSEIKVNNPLISFDDLMKQGLYGNANRTIAVFKQMGFTMNDYGKGLEGFFKELSQEDKIKIINIAKKMNK